MPDFCIKPLSVRALTLIAALFGAVCFWQPARAYAQDGAARAPACSCDLPSAEPSALQLTVDVLAAGGGGSDHLLGAGGALRIGKAFRYMEASLIPEGGLEAFAFSGDKSTQLFGAFVGGRLRFGRGIVPGVFAHAGVAGVRWRDNYAAPTVDLGVSVDLTFIPKVLVGVQAMYKSTFAAGGNPALELYVGGATIGYRI